jgi:DNA-binding NarL/FixJ family response regulator
LARAQQIAIYAPFRALRPRRRVGMNVAIEIMRVARLESWSAAAVKTKVLIIDDDASIRQQLYWSLCDDYDVMTAEDLPTAIRRATVYNPAVSLLDLHLPPVLDSTHTGLRILEFIKAHCPRSKVFVVSSEDSAETQAACAAYGADGFLSKPLDVEQLHSTLRQTALTRQFETACT